jgi:predicted nucleotidyltransferase
VTDPLHDRVRAVLARGPRLRFAILFGSRARGDARVGSDVDIAIAPAEPLSQGEEDALALELERALGLSVDVVDLDRAPNGLRWRIARDGVVLLSSPPHAATRFLAREGIEHDSSRELEADAARRFRARLGAGSVDPHR